MDFLTGKNLKPHACFINFTEKFYSIDFGVGVGKMMIFMEE